MNIEIMDDFKEYLKLQYPESTGTVKNRVSNLKTILREYQDIANVNSFNDIKKYIDLFEYSKEDFKKGKPVLHNVLINGNLYTNTQTYKSTLKIYQEFLYLKEYLDSNDLDIINYNNKSNLIKTLIHFKSVISKYQDKKGKISDVSTLQNDIYAKLELQCKNINWELEHCPDSSKKDSVDIYGFSKSDNTHFVIELDAHRADQVAKKFLSRFSLFIDQKVIYIALCYPGTKNMSIPECKKYFDYCNNICKGLNSKKIIKQFNGIMLFKHKK